MTIELKMPALSPTMEKGTLAKWLVGEGNTIKPGDLLAEIETDKATMELEASDGGRISRLIVMEGTDDVAVGTIIALIDVESEAAGEVAGGQVSTADLLIATEDRADAGSFPEPAPTHIAAAAAQALSAPSQAPIAKPPTFASSIQKCFESKMPISPLAKRIAAAKSLDVSSIVGSGPGGRILRADLKLGSPSPVEAVSLPVLREAPPVTHSVPEIPHDVAKLSSMRKTIARRMLESKQQAPHIYLSIDIDLDPLLRLRAELNEALATRNIRVSVNDMMIKAQAQALAAEPACNVQFTTDALVHFQRVDISVAVSLANGLITPIIVDASNKSLSAISSEMSDLASRARDGKLEAHEYRGGTASLSNMGMYGIKTFSAIINSPQAMILAIGEAQRRTIVQDDAIRIGTIISATGSFDHRAIDGADAARFMKVLKHLIEEPHLLLA